MSAYILSVCGAVIFSSLVTIILPDGKIGKFINGVLKLTCVFVMLSPIISWINDLKPSKKDIETSKEVTIDQNYLEYFYDLQAQSLTDEIKSTIEKEFKITVFVEIEWQISKYAFDVKKVHINIKDFGINEKNKHIIIIEQVKTRVSEMMNVKGDLVLVNEN